MTKYRLPILIGVSLAIAAAIGVDAQAPVAAVLWAVLVALWAGYFRGNGEGNSGDRLRIPGVRILNTGIRSLSPEFPSQESGRNSESVPFFPRLILVLAAAAAVRLYQLSSFPLGPFVDEIFALNNSLLLLDKPFDPFGHTLTLSEAWGKDHPNLFLYLNLPVLKLLGVGYWSTKLLTVIPGVLACGAVYLLARRIFDNRVALGTALLFTFAHWSVRLNRYGWDATLMILLFAVTLWLLILAMQSGRAFYAYCSGTAAGLSLYTYLGARVAVLAVIAFLALECVLRRDRSIYRQAAAFTAGGAAAAYPFFCYYASNPRAFWGRTSQVSVFNSDHPLAVIFQNLASHALMFHWAGGRFARDNFPGSPMLDPLTGLVLIIGVLILIRKMDVAGRLISWCFLITLAAGVFSISQEGAPYVYRTAAVIVPAFLVIGIGLQWLTEKLATRWVLLWCTAAIALNLYLYFGLEAKNIAAMRVMAYEPRLIGLEIARDDRPVWLVVPDVLTQTEVRPRPQEKYPEVNPAVILPSVVRKLAIINFSGRYDAHRTLEDNLLHPQGIHFVEPAVLKTGHWVIQKPATVIFASNDQEMNRIVTKLGASIRYVPNMLGEPFLAAGRLE